MREFVDGNTAIARGALDAGCNFYAGYPITPATPILLYMAHELPKVGGILIQGEDEIASIGMCIGAALAGARPLTATSGPGISLYSENIGLAIMAEAPLVIVDVQRMGPATGAATTGAQGDVQFVRWGTSGGYPIVALAPSTVPQCYTLTMKAFDIAERLRTPVFVLTDKELSSAMATVETKDFREVKVGSRPIAPPDRPFVPYLFETPESVPAFSPYGGAHVVRYTTSTHDEYGYLTKDPEKVNRLNQHLAAKIEARRDELEMVETDLQEGARVLFLSYGITAQAMAEAVEEAREAGEKVSSITVLSVWPVPEKAILKATKGVDRIVVAELNHGQYLREVERVVYHHFSATGEKPPEVVGLNKVDGTLISPSEFLKAMEA
jgi:2-oxoglutarate ferredoxin oxidoreductase subunit alpha